MTFTATVTSGGGTPGGTVTFKDGAVTLFTGPTTGGVASFTTSSLSVGAHPITATFTGNASFANSTSPTFNQTVNQDVGGPTVGSSLNPSTLGQQVTFTATVTASPPGAGTPTGTVTFLDGATPLATNVPLTAGQATFSTTALTVGAHPITVQYSGDANFSAATSPVLNQTVDLGPTTTTVQSDLNPSTVGAQVTFTATVAPQTVGAGTPTGTVDFLDGVTPLATNVALAGGQATFQTSALTPGNHNITAVYSGDASFATSTSTALTQTVNLNTRIFVADAGANAIHVQDATTNAVVQTISGGFLGTPVQAISNQTNIFIANASSNIVSVPNDGVNNPTQTLLTSGGFLSSPRGLVLLGGSLYIADFNNNSIVSFDGIAQAVVAQGGLISSPVGIVTDGTDLFVACKGNSSIVKVTTAGVTNVFAAGGLLVQPSGLVRAGNGDFFVSDQGAGSGKVVKVTAAAVQSLITSGTVGTAFGITLRPNGDLIVSDDVGNQLFNVTQAGVVTAIVGTFNQPLLLSTGPAF